jgi:hypothetical protein
VTNRLAALALLLALCGPSGNSSPPAAAPADLAAALAGSDAAVAARAEGEVVARFRARLRELAGRGAWRPEEVRSLLALALVDPERFVADAALRARVLALLPRVLAPGTPPALRDDLLFELNQVREVDFAAADAVAAAWGAVPRQALARRVGYAPGLRFADEPEAPLAASVYSLPSFFFDAADAGAFLAGVRAVAPGRPLLALVDLPLHRGLAARARALGIELLETYGRPYSPWPRDPFSLVRTAQGGVQVLARPNLQPGREEDANLGPELVRDLPAAIDHAWGGATWAQAPVPFHNGQVLLTRQAAWITLHTLEPRILALLGLARVPVESFATADGIDRYLAAAQRAAAELAALYGRPVRFVHPLPETGDLAARLAAMRAIGGGAGYDLDSELTLVPRGGGRLAALVADVQAGRELLRHLTAADRAALRRRYGLEPDGEALAAALAAAQETPAAAGLDAFLDLVARHLAGEGIAVRRLPLLSVPVALLRDRAGLSHREFLLTWNNVVVETRGGRVRAEGFASLLPPGDRAARTAFAALGCRLDLVPPLVRSVVLNGGYRCASNHVRGRS